MVKHLDPDGVRELKKGQLVRIIGGTSSTEDLNADGTTMRGRQASLDPYGWIGEGEFIKPTAKGGEVYITRIVAQAEKARPPKVHSTIEVAWFALFLPPQ